MTTTDQPTLFDQLARTTDPDTSHSAAASMIDHLGHQRRQVMACIGVVGGATAYEVAERLGLQQNVVARRCTDLRELGRIIDSGRRRPGSSGRLGIVWIIRRMPDVDVIEMPYPEESVRAVR